MFSGGLTLCYKKVSVFNFYLKGVKWIKGDIKVLSLVIKEITIFYINNG